MAIHNAIMMVGWWQCIEVNFYYHGGGNVVMMLCITLMVVIVLVIVQVIEILVVLCCFCCTTQNICFYSDLDLLFEREGKVSSESSLFSLLNFVFCK